MKPLWQSSTWQRNYLSTRWLSWRPKGKLDFWRKRKSTTWGSIMPTLKTSKRLKRSSPIGRKNTMKEKSSGERGCPSKWNSWRTSKNRQQRLSNSSGRHRHSSKNRKSRREELMTNLMPFPNRSKLSYRQWLGETQRTVATKMQYLSWRQRSSSLRKSWRPKRNRSIN